MNRTALCIQMLVLLKARGKMNTAQLAEALETNPRNIREFKKELETANYPVHVERGPAGGYTLLSDEIFPTLQLSAAQQSALIEARSMLKTHPEFSSWKDFEKALDTILASQKVSLPSSRSYLQVRTIPLNEQEVHWKELMHKACMLQNSLRITYQKIGAKEPETYEIEPYEIVECAGASYLVGYSLKSQGFRTWRISKTRLFDVQLASRTFEKDEDFALFDYVSKDAIFKGKMDRYEIEVRKECEQQFLEIYWGADLEKTGSRDGWISYQFLSDQPVLIQRQLFSLLNQVKLIHPQAVAVEYQKNLGDALHLYEENGQ